MTDAALPTIELRDACVRRRGAVLTEALGFCATEPRVGLVGDCSALLQTLTGQAQLASGSARLLGSEFEFALERCVLGLALCDPPLPDSFTVREYLQHAARLSHGSRSRALGDAQQVLDRFGLNPLAARKVAQTTSFQRRAVGIAQACLGSPSVVWLESPLHGLDAAAADYVARLCVEAAAHSRLILSAPRPSSPSAELTLLETCDALYLIERGVLVAQGTPAQVLAPNGRYALRVTGEHTAAYPNALRAAGCVVTSRDEPGDYLVELPPNESTDLLLDTALAQQLVVLTLEPCAASEAPGVR